MIGLSPRAAVAKAMACQGFVESLWFYVIRWNHKRLQRSQRRNKPKFLKSVTTRGSSFAIAAFSCWTSRRISATWSAIPAVSSSKRSAEMPSPSRADAKRSQTFCKTKNTSVSARSCANELNYLLSNSSFSWLSPPDRALSNGDMRSSPSICAD